MLRVSVQKTQKKVFIRLKAIECLTYDCPDSGKLEMLYQMLKTLEDKFSSSGWFATTACFGDPYCNSSKISFSEI